MFEKKRLWATLQLEIRSKTHNALPTLALAYFLSGHLVSRFRPSSSGKNELPITL